MDFMAAQHDDNAIQAIREVIDQLRNPIPNINTLLLLLTSPLDAIDLLPPHFRRHNARRLPTGSHASVLKRISTFQEVILQHVLPTWDVALADINSSTLLDQYFCPDAILSATPAAGEVAFNAYSTILSRPLTDYSIGLLSRLSVEYPIDRLHGAIYGPGNLSGKLGKGGSGGTGSGDPAQRSLQWEDCVRNVVAVPAKVANALGKRGGGGWIEIPPKLEQGEYFNHVSLRCECLISNLAANPIAESLQSISYLLQRLVYIGAFPASPPISRTQPSFFQATLSVIRSRLRASDGKSPAPTYSSLWNSLFSSTLPSLALQAILTSLCGTLAEIHITDTSPKERARTKLEGQLLRDLAGPLESDEPDLWEVAMGIILGRDWAEGYARVFVCWAAGAGRGTPNEQALEKFLNAVLAVWSSPDHVKHSLISKHRYITALLLLVITSFPSSAKPVQSLASSPAFVSGIGKYVSHLDPSVRRCGMLVGEVVAKLAGKKLDFGGWEGDSEGRPWARNIRQLIQSRDIDADLNLLGQEQAEPEVENTTAGVEPSKATPESFSKDNSVPARKAEPRAAFAPVNTGYDSDDSMEGYASPPSSRSASPTPSELEEIEKDPTLNVGNAKVARPVYLMQLGELLRPTGGPKKEKEPHEADKIEMALNVAEELIRKKAEYGTELEENAVNLAYALMGLQDNFDLEGFNVKRQNAMNALVARCPRKAAPAIIEEFFKNQYSTEQRYVALNALALGARELASLPVPQSTVPPEKVAFPSKMLPPALHQKYLTAGGQQRSRNLLPHLVEDISRKAIDRNKEATEDKVPELVRERRLRIQPSRKITELPNRAQQELSLLQQQGSGAGTQKRTTFTEVAAEYFIAPLINRFWQFLRDEQTREERTAHFEGRNRYHGAGTGLILNAVVLSHFLNTVSILVHASQNAPEWLSIMAPEALGLAMTIGTRPVSHMEVDGDSDDEDAGSQNNVNPIEKQRKEAAVMTSALELALVVLDGSIELDGGRVLGLEHTSLVLGVGEWAKTLFSLLEKGVKVAGGGGKHEIRLNRAAAGVLLKIDELTSKWRRSMIEM
ncbi:hypothetical protein AX16_008162 [Volvariella volvacea WC 439]|nr:hypothetical protein AX16_008162 [Volvariella volvacea WC 439]